MRQEAKLMFRVLTKGQQQSGAGNFGIQRLKRQEPPGGMSIMRQRRAVGILSADVLWMANQFPRVRRG